MSQYYTRDQLRRSAEDGDTQKLVVLLNLKRDADIVKFMWKVRDKENYIKNLIRQDMEEKGWNTAPQRVRIPKKKGS